MKTILKNDQYISCYVFEDLTYIETNIDKIIIGNPVEFIIDDLNQSNTTIVENVTPPSDWIGRKYLLIDNQWVENPNFIPLDPDYPRVPKEV